MVQAGGSPIGMAFAIPYGDYIFTSHSGIESAQRFYRAMKGLVAAAGRDPNSVEFLLSIQP